MYDQRFRSSERDDNGMPSIGSPKKSVKQQLTHLVYTRGNDGQATLYINGTSVQSGRVPGNLTNWDAKARFGLGNEATGDRSWLGKMYLVAVYNRALPTNEVSQHFKIGVPAAQVVVAKPPPKPAPVKKPAAPRIAEGLLALYTFSDGDGNVVKDRSGQRPAHDLTITKRGSVQRGLGSLTITGDTLLKSERAPKELANAIRNSGALSLEAWLKPANTKQEGPARIFTLSKDSVNRNLTLGQEGNRFDVRLRTSNTSANGIPSLEAKSNSATTALAHLVYTREKNGKARLFINGKLDTEKNIAGDLKGWDQNFNLAIGNEFTGGRAWLGTFYRVALYDRVLDSSTIRAAFDAGVDAEIKLPPAPDRNAELFETTIAPILATHCLECHDSATREGKLDLSKHATTLAAGKKKKVLVPGNAEASELWQEVLSDNMPEDRPPLSKEEKAALKQWIDGGAQWTIAQIDPADFLHQDTANEVYVQRLTVEEYIASVKATLGVDVTREARDLLPPDLRADGFSNTAYNLGVDLKHVQAYAKLSEIAVSRTDVLAFAGRFGKSRKLIDKDMRALIENMGAWVLRGPLSNREINLYRGISTTTASAGGNFEDAVTYILEAMLQAPRFIYRIEDQDGGREVNDHELAARLSYMIWGASPDETLLRAAENNSLSNPDQIQQQVDRMLKDPRAMKRAARFAFEWLDLGRMDNLAPNPQKFPAWNSALAKDMRNETIAYFVEVAWKQQQPLSALFNTQLTFATPQLAKHYGLKPKGEGLQRYDVSAVPYRGGLLTQGSVLTIGGDTASMVTRGLFLLHDVLRGVVKPPPPGLDITPIPSRKGLTQRDAAEIRINDNQCGGCHSKFAPLAFALEKFAGIGAYSDRDRFNNALRENGEILIPGTAAAVSYNNGRELADLLAGSDRVRKTITHKIAQFALGRPLGGADARALEEIHIEAQKQGGSYQATITALAKSKLLRERHQAH